LLLSLQLLLLQHMVRVHHPAAAHRVGHSAVQKLLRANAAAKLLLLLLTIERREHRGIYSLVGRLGCARVGKAGVRAAPVRVHV
jgi:hypothetical protein